MKHPNLTLDRVIDANLNRLREGVRVTEDLLRYIYNEKEIAKDLKELRHQVRYSQEKKCLKARDSQGDILRPTLKQEQARGDIESLFVANFKRAQESARVLEESLKLLSPDEAEGFKAIRYALYTLEQRTMAVIGSTS